MAASAAVKGHRKCDLLVDFWGLFGFLRILSRLSSSDKNLILTLTLIILSLAK